MTEGSNVAIREGEKLKGSVNYYVWALKMSSILRAEGQWGVTEQELVPVAFPAVIDGEQLTKTMLKK